MDKQLEPIDCYKLFNCGYSIMISNKLSPCKVEVDLENKRLTCAYGCLNEDGTYKCCFFCDEDCDDIRQDINNRLKVIAFLAKLKAKK